MPVYEFRCKHCGEVFEIIASYDERREKAVCPSCDRRDAAQSFSGFKPGGSRLTLNPGTFVHSKRPKEWRPKER